MTVITDCNYARAFLEPDILCVNRLCFSLRIHLPYHGSPVRIDLKAGFRSLEIQAEPGELYRAQRLQLLLHLLKIRLCRILRHDLYRILPDGEDKLCTVYPQKKHVMFSFESVSMTTRLLEGEFLNWRSAIPAEQPINLRVNRAELISAVERVSLIISERLKNPVRCLFDGNSLKLSCITALGRSYDEIAIPDCGTKIEIGFNNRYLLDALRACQDEEIVLGLRSSLSSFTMRPVEGDRYVYLVLPVRLKAGE